MGPTISHPGASMSGIANAQAISSMIASGLTSEGLMLLMQDSLASKNDQLRGLVDRYMGNNALEKAYVQYSNVMRQLHSVAMSCDGSDRLVRMDEIAKLNLPESLVEKFAAIAGDDRQLSVNEVAGILNGTFFPDRTDLHMTFAGDADSFNRSLAEFQSHVLEAIDNLREENVEDTTILQMDINKVSQALQRDTSHFTKLMKSLHDNAMEIIRNM